ncbi:MAG: HsdR family type I site-specific deoxyribonuclease [Tissierellia bacterium]|nr:HsdR family type I site-specific deoxyribonuclease [Tissierellia bacterium]
MTKIIKDSSEKAFQERFVKELEKYKWQAPDYLNGNIKNVTVDDLIDNWRKELNRINADMLEGVELTDNEFKQVMQKVNQISNSYEAAKILSMEQSKGKIDGIIRDNLEGVSRSRITLTIFTKAQVRGGESSYQIAREVSSKNNNRFDIVLLINGLPLINIEQKRTDKSLEEAFGQFKRYYKDGEFSNNFMAFSQMMVISSEIETRYFATPKSLDDFNPAFVFHWSDENNNRVNEWRDVIKQFLMIPMAHQMVGDYLVIDEALHEENKRHMLMRPYQVHALRAINLAAHGKKREDGMPTGGFVWHTTGSGKTITSFKTALFLSTRAGFDKVVFLVDRRELDAKTSENFKAYAEYESVTVDDTKYTYELAKRLKSPINGIVVTTTFKLNNLVKELEENDDRSLADKKFIFIIDEAHRTTMGQMMGSIKSYFKKNALFYGFTGTPLFEENKAPGMVNEKSELIDTTEKLFGPMLHEYTIEEAIADENVLGFHVDYLNTGEFKNHDDLREKLIRRYQAIDPSRSVRDIEKEIIPLSDADVERLAKKLDILVYDDRVHIPVVVDEILRNWEMQSQNRKFNAILTVAYKERVVKYYEEFKKQLKERDMDLNVAMTFSFGDENDPYNIANEINKVMFEDYGKFTGIEFNPGDSKRGEKAYFEDLVDRATRGGSGRNPKNIDLVIVADQLLTGYDSKFLNTLYVDRSLELQGLIQAYSRTNRVYGKGKEFGSIINFQYPKITEENVNKALKLYGSGGKSNIAIVDKYDVAVQKFRIKIINLINTLKDPTKWPEIKDDTEKLKEFKFAFSEAVSQYNKVLQYYQYEWNDEEFGIDEHSWLKYQGAYKNLNPKSEDDETDPPEIILPGRTKLSGTQIIDAAHILKLIGSKVKDNKKGFQFVDDETLRLIYEDIQELSNMGDDENAKLLKKFVDEELLTGKIPIDQNFDAAFEDWKKSIKIDLIKEFAKKWGLDFHTLSDTVERYSLSDPENIPNDEELKGGLDYENASFKAGKNKLEQNMALNSALPDFLAEIKEKYY